MRIAFVSGNREQLPDAVVPLGLLYVIAATPDRHEKVLIDLCFETEPEKALRARLHSFRPDLVAVGLRNIQNSDYSGISDNLAYYAGLIAAAREVSAAPIVMGGGGFSVMPGELMQHLRADYGIAGEGERAFPQLVESLEGKRKPLTGIGNLHYFEDGELISNPPEAQFLDMNRLPVPDRSLADPRYCDLYGIESVQTKRGCPLRCEYCTYPVIEGRIGRAREPAAVVDEMFQVLEQRPQTRHFFIVDSVFNLPKTHAKNVCREMIARGWKVPWTCYANPLGFDQEFAELASAAGCAGMEVGSDSGCNEILTRLRKGFTVDHIRDLHQICLAAKIPDCHTFILGTRGESLDHVHRTLNFIVDLDPFSAIVMIWIDDYEALDPALRAERRKLRRQIEGILRDRVSEYPHWIVPPLEINFSSRLFEGLRRRGLHGPLWQHIRLRSRRPSRNRIPRRVMPVGEA